MDYNQSLADMILARNYDWHNNDINEENFPLSGEGVQNVACHLVHLDRQASTDEVISYFDTNGYRAATLEEMLAFGVKYPNIQKGFLIVALGSVLVDRSGDCCVPYLSDNGDNRGLCLYWDSYGWDNDDRFLAVRK